MKLSTLPIANPLVVLREWSESCLLLPARRADSGWAERKLHL